MPGRQALLGAQVWVEDTNRAGGIRLHSRQTPLPLRLTFYDDASAPEQCAVLTERLITEDQVDILLGPYSSGLALRAAEVAQRFQRVLWNHGGASEAIYTRGFAWVVGILSPPSTYFHSVIDLVRHTRPSASHVAIVHSTAGAFPKDVAAGAVQYCQQQGFETVHTYPYPAGTTDFTSILKQLESATPAVVLSVGRIEDDLRFATQYLQHKIPADVVGLIVTPLTLFRDTFGSAAAHFVGPSQWEPTIVTAPGYGPSSAGGPRASHSASPGGRGLPHGTSLRWRSGGAALSRDRRDIGPARPPTGRKYAWISPRFTGAIVLTLARAAS